jgi:hypothetical protein
VCRDRRYRRSLQGDCSGETEEVERKVRSGCRVGVLEGKRRAQEQKRSGETNEPTGRLAAVMGRNQVKSNAGPIQLERRGAVTSMGCMPGPSLASRAAFAKNSVQQRSEGRVTGRVEEGRNEKRSC